MEAKIMPLFVLPDGSKPAIDISIYCSPRGIFPEGQTKGLLLSI